METLDFSKVADPVALLQEMTDGRGPDVCIDAVGLEARGSLLHDVMGKRLIGVTIRTAQCDVKRYMPHLLEHIRSGHLDPKQLITHRVPLDVAPEMYRLFAARADGIIKSVLIPPGAE